MICGSVNRLRSSSAACATLRPSHCSALLTRVSADSFVDEKSGLAFFTGEVVVPRSELDRLKAVDSRFELRAGLPVEVLVTLRRRTALEYLLEPLFSQFWGSMHES